MKRRDEAFLRALLIALAVCYAWRGIPPLYAQSAKAIRINEVLVINEDNFLDQYGHRSPWVELYNSSAGSVNVGGCYLTDDIKNPTKYPIPRGDVETVVKPYQHLLFYADASPIKGTFHLNFTLDPQRANFIAFFDSDGRTLVDSVTIPAAAQADVSYGRYVDGTGKWVTYEKVTPKTNNKTLDKNEKVENLKKNDPDGIAITIISMSVVILALIIAYFIYRSMGKVFSHKRERQPHTVVKDMSNSNIKPISREDEAVYAAIAMALYEMFESGYEKEGEITMSPIKKVYSPWSSKIQTMRQYPR